LLVYIHATILTSKSLMFETPEVMVAYLTPCGTNVRVWLKQTNLYLKFTSVTGELPMIHL